MNRLADLREVIELSFPSKTSKYNKFYIEIRLYVESILSNYDRIAELCNWKINFVLVQINLIFVRFDKQDDQNRHIEMKFYFKGIEPYFKIIYRDTKKQCVVKGRYDISKKQKFNQNMDVLMSTIKIRNPDYK